jgi:ParB-like chromosome segregation protein Spo0J
MAHQLFSVGPAPDQSAGSDSGAATTGVVRIDQLRLGGTPRLAGLNDEHVRLLAESVTDLPPILVHRATRTVVDGVHRLAAARLCGRDTIPVRWFDGSTDDGFMVAVMANIAHGLPLTLADREAAAARILAARPEASDRFVAETTGLAPSTVAQIRQRSGGASAAATRIGRDGRARPVNSADGRRLARDLIAEDPLASLREIARKAGISPATVRDVREKMRRGDDPVGPDRRWMPGADGLAASRARAVGRSGEADRPVDVAVHLHKIGRDPSLRFNESGRTLLRWLFTRAEGLDQWKDMAPGLPPHSAYLLAAVAASCAEEWSAFADYLRRSVNAA